MESINKKRLLFIAPSAYPFGGVAVWLDYLLPGLGKKGWDVVLCLTKGKWHAVDKYVKEHPFGNIAEIENKTGSAEGRIRSICNAINKYQPDIVISVYVPDVYSALERIRMSNRKSPRLVATMHGIKPDEYEDIHKFRALLNAVICTNRLSCRLAIEESAFESERVFYAPYGVAPEKLPRPIEKRKTLRIAYSGRLDFFQKRVDDIPQILALLDRKGVDYEFVIAGGGPAEKELKRQINSAGQADKTKFTGILSWQDLVTQVYNLSDVLLLTSSWETGPIVIWEAMAHGMAVVTSSYVGSGLEGSLKDGENCLLFPVGDIDRAAECIKSLTDPERRKIVVEGGYRLIESRYSRENSINTWSRCFDRIIEIPLLCAPAKNLSLPPAGRLDRLFGNRMAEDIRSFLGLHFTHTNPGGEWPHSYGKRKDDDRIFWEKAKVLDKGL